MHQLTKTSLSLLTITAATASSSQDRFLAPGPSLRVPPQLQAPGDTSVEPAAAAAPVAQTHDIAFEQLSKSDPFAAFFKLVTDTNTNSDDKSASGVSLRRLRTLSMHEFRNLREEYHRRRPEAAQGKTGKREEFVIDLSASEVQDLMVFGNLNGNRERTSSDPTLPQLQGPGFQDPGPGNCSIWYPAPPPPPPLDPEITDLSQTSQEPRSRFIQDAEVWQLWRPEAVEESLNEIVTVQLQALPQKPQFRQDSEEFELWRREDEPEAEVQALSQRPCFIQDSEVWELWRPVQSDSEEGKQDFVTVQPSTKPQFRQDTE